MQPTIATATAPTIAIANYDFRSSGTVAKSIEIATAANAAGLPVELWAIRAQGPLLARVPRGIRVVSVGSGRPWAGRTVDMTLSLFHLAAALRRERPAVLMSGGNHLHRICRAALDLSGSRPDTHLILRASNSSRRAGRPDAQVHKHVQRKYHGADMVAAVSEELADEICAAGVREPVRTVANGVDIGRVARMAADPFDHPFLHSGAPVIAGMGRLARQKGFDVVLRAFARLRRRQDARLLLIGGGKAEKRAQLQAIAAEEGIVDAVDLLDYRDNPFAILARADLFVSGSRWEGASNSLIEALACGLPLAATDCPTGVREVVAQGRYGTLAPVDDIDGLAGAMAHELVVRRDRRQQAAGARKWSIERCLADWIALLDREYGAALGDRGLRMAG